MEEIDTLDNFREIKSKGLGYIAITDKNLPINCVHLTSCYEVQERYFNQKVILSGRKNGSYYFTNEYQEALNKFVKMKPCQTCFGQ